MEYGKIISISGMGGLYELVGSKKDGAIVRSLEDKSTKFVASRIHNFSHLESIEVYTVRDNVNLVDVLNAMKDSKEPLPSEKDAAAIKAYFQKVYPDMDFERVYASDMKKMVKWYSLLSKNDVEFKISDEPEEEEETPIAEVEAEKPAKKAKAAAKEETQEAKEAKEEAAPKKEAKPKAAKPKAAKAADKADDAEAKPAPKKKAAPKKKSEE